MNPWFAAIIGGVLGAVLGAQATKRRLERSSSRALPASVTGGTVHVIPADTPEADEVFVLGPACSRWEIVDRPRMELLIKHAYYTARLHGLTDPYAVSEIVVDRVIPQCRTRATGIRNPEELSLYGLMFTTVTEMLYNEGAIDHEQWSAVAEDFDEWYETQQERLR